MPGGTRTRCWLLLCRLNITFTYSMPAVGEERGKMINATQVAVLKVMQRSPVPFMPFASVSQCCTPVCEGLSKPGTLRARRLTHAIRPQAS